MKLGSLMTTMITFAALAACDDDVEPVEEQQMRLPDAAATPIKVSNAGTACSLLTWSCRGTAAQCLEISYSGAFYPGGYCTADCRRSAECGLDAVCPVSEAQLESPEYPFRSTWARKCFKTCTPADASSCRAGYACMSLAEVYLADDAPTPMQTPVCVPRWPTFSGDAGNAAQHPIDAGL
jgi:hypothetical protein